MKVPVARDAIQIDGLKHLCEWANKQGAIGKAIEIGSYSGMGTVILSQHFKEVFAIDPWLNGYDINDSASQICPMKLVFKEFEDRIQDLKNVSFERCKSIEGLEFVKDGSCDLIYLDGDHRYESVLNDLKGWKPKLRAGGIMAGHDWSWQSIKKALKEEIGDKGYTLFQDDSWAIKL